MDARGERNGSTAIAVEIILITELTGGGGRRGRFLSANSSLAPSLFLSLSRRESSTRTPTRTETGRAVLRGMVKIRGEPS